METQNKTCFLVCPIGEEGSETRQRSDDLLKYLIEPVCNECGYDVIRVDRIHAPDKIDNTIFEYLINSDLVIADVSEHNPNALLELGYRMGKEKPCIQIRHKGTKLPFDINSIRTFEYTTEGKIGVLEKYKSDLKEVISNIDKEIEARAELEKTSNNTNEKIGINNATNKLIIDYLSKIYNDTSYIKNNISNMQISSNSIIPTTTKPLTDISFQFNPNDFMMVMLKELINNPSLAENIFELEKIFNAQKLIKENQANEQ